jgi:GrpB-like predicted nucleotidyltransferase (UPF0157 family)
VVDDVAVLVFRDYLRDHPHARRTYETVKRCVAAEHRQDPQASNDGKDDVVECILTTAQDAGYEPEYEPRPDRDTG